MKCVSLERLYKAKSFLGNCRIAIHIRLSAPCGPDFCPNGHMSISQRYNKTLILYFCPYLYSYMSYAKGRLVLTDALLL